MAPRVIAGEALAEIQSCGCRGVGYGEHDACPGCERVYWVCDCGDDTVAAIPDEPCAWIRGACRDCLERYAAAAASDPSTVGSDGWDAAATVILGRTVVTTERELA